jgi:hypothetical protein
MSWNYVSVGSAQFNGVLYLLGWFVNRREIMNRCRTMNRSVKMYSSGAINVSKKLTKLEKYEVEL